MTKLISNSLILAAVVGLAGCDLVLLNPAGDIARQQSNLLISATLLMLLIVIPVIFMSIYFAWKFRESNTDAEYDPDWDHSTQIELYVWAAPLLIIIALGAMTWVNTHTLDPYRPLDRITKGQPTTEDTPVLRIQAIALEWKWLFVYPDLGIATVNEVAAPIDMPIRFQITSPKLMNSLFIPTLAGMVYGMPGMETKIHAVINELGDYEGVSGNYSGEGYSNMRFRFKGLSDSEFEAWVAEAKSSDRALDRMSYTRLTEHSFKHPVERFASVEAGLYQKILNLCVDSDKLCINDMMVLDEQTANGALRCVAPDSDESLQFSALSLETPDRPLLTPSLMSPVTVKGN